MVFFIYLLVLWRSPLLLLQLGLRLYFWWDLPNRRLLWVSLSARLTFVSLPLNVVTLCPPFWSPFSVLQSLDVCFEVGRRGRWGRGRTSSSTRVGPRYTSAPFETNLWSHIQNGLDDDIRTERWSTGVLTSGWRVCVCVGIYTCVHTCVCMCKRVWVCVYTCNTYVCMCT